jgi:GT2 family glycosyltransferase
MRQKEDDKYCPLVYNVVLNFNRRQEALACLASLSAGTYPNQRTLVLDVASSSDSLPAISDCFPAVEVLPLAENKGYAGNNNSGISMALERGAEWVFLLNEDTLVDPACLGHLVAVGRAFRDAGVLGPTVYHLSEPDVIQSAGGTLDRFWRSAHRGQNERDSGQFQQVRETDWISGCALLVRREAVEKAGKLDERFFCYFEETEWCLRVKRQGWRIFHVPEARIWHKGVQRDYRPGPDVAYYSTRNRFLLLSKHRAPVRAWCCAVFETVRTLTSWTVRPRWRAMRDHRDAMWQGTVDFLRRRHGMRPKR